MKRLYFLLVFTALAAPSAQSQGWRIAPTIGLNASTISYSAAFRNSLNSNILTTKTGPVAKLQLGALLDYALSDRFSIRSGLLYTGKGGSLRFNSAQYTTLETLRGGYYFDYLDVPLLLNFAVGRNNWRVIVGGVAGITLSARGVLQGSNVTGYGYYQGNTTRLTIGTGSNQIQPLDFSTTLGFVKELEIDNRPVEVGLYFQSSLTKWNSYAKINPDYYARNYLIGLRAAYFFELRR